MKTFAATPPTVKGWCPGALRPMASGDGLIVRVKVSGGRLDTPRMRALAALGRRCGNGAFDLSQRANLQMRGASEATLPDIHAALDMLGMLSPDEASEQVLNVVGPPLAGLDPTALLDARAIVESLEAQLRDDLRLHALPGKFGFVVDDGGLLAMSGVDVDIALEALGSDAVALRLAGDADRVALVPAASAVESAAALARAFLALSATRGARRMRALVSAEGADAVFATASLAAVSRPRRAPTQAADVLGAHALGDSVFVGCAAPFGRWGADRLERLADCVEAAGGGALRLTPWRAILAPGLAPDRAAALVADLAEQDFMVDPADPRAKIVACPGAPDCPSASVRTHDIAASLAPLLTAAPVGVRLHVSGCEKGCAHPGSLPFTLVGRDGRFDLVADGAPGAAPLVCGLDIEAAHCELRRRMSQDAPT